MRTLAAVVALAVTAQTVSGTNMRAAFPASSGMDTFGHPISMDGLLNRLIHEPSTGGVRVVFATTPSSMHDDAQMLSEVQRLDEAMNSFFNMMNAMTDPQFGLHSNLRGRQHRPHLCLHRCREDIQRFCSKERHVADAVVQCLVRNKQSVSFHCRPVVNRLVEANALMAPASNPVGEQPSDPVTHEEDGQVAASNGGHAGVSTDGEDPASLHGHPVADIIKLPPAHVAASVDDTPPVSKRVAAWVAFNHGFLMTVLVQVLVLMALIQVVRALLVKVRAPRLSGK